MKVLDIYNKNDLDVLSIKGRTIKEIMDKFFQRFPSSYRRNYDRNLEGLTIWRVDDAPDRQAAFYLPLSNLLIFQDIGALPHELQHVSSYDGENNSLGFVKNFQFPLYEMALLEGMAEFLSALSLEDAVEDYFFECFVVSMLSSIDGIFESFYIPNHDKFISLFPNKKDIYSLMYSLDFYHDMTDEMDKFNKEDMIRLRQSINDTIDSLIDIELSFNKPLIERRRYVEKFMDLISVDDIKFFLSDIYSEYRNYAFKQVKKRMLGRK